MTDQENQSMQVGSSHGNKQAEPNKVLSQDEEQVGVKHIYVQNKAIRTLINVELQLDPEIYELLKVVSYRDGLDDPSKISKLQLESFAERAIREKIDQSLRDYPKLGEIYSRRIQRKHKHLVTLKEVPNPDSYGGLGTKLVPLDSEEENREFIGFS